MLKAQLVVLYTRPQRLLGRAVQAQVTVLKVVPQGQVRTVGHWQPQVELE